MNRVTDDPNALDEHAAADGGAARLPTPPFLRSRTAASPRRLWQLLAWVAAVVFGVMSVAAFVSAWHTQQRVQVARAGAGQAPADQPGRRHRGQAAGQAGARQRARRQRQAGRARRARGRVAAAALAGGRPDPVAVALARRERAGRRRGRAARGDAAGGAHRQHRPDRHDPEAVGRAPRALQQPAPGSRAPRRRARPRSRAHRVGRRRAVARPSASTRPCAWSTSCRWSPRPNAPPRAGRAAASAALPRRRAAARGAAAARAGSAASAVGRRRAPPAWVASLQRAWEGFSVPFFGELRQAVRVTSIEHPEAVLMTPDQSFFLRENVKLRLLNARLSHPVAPVRPRAGRPAAGADGARSLLRPQLAPRRRGVRPAAPGGRAGQAGELPAPGRHAGRDRRRGRGPLSAARPCAASSG